MPYLIDDGTLDTVIRCECGHEHRFNYNPEGADGCLLCNGTGLIVSEEYPGLPSIACADCGGTGSTPDDYEAFVANCIADIIDSCECHETKE